MLILGLDSSAVAGSCALCEISGEKKTVIAASFVNTKLTHSQTLMPMVEDMLKSSGFELKDIDLLAVNSGPGSFTGIRIGVAAVKGIAFALGKPCVGVSTLHSLAYNLSGHRCIACAVMDARCNQFYNALFEINGEQINRLTPDRAISAAELAEELNQYADKKVILAGDGAELAYRSINGSGIALAPLTVRLQRAENVCLAAAEYESVTARELLPAYLRLPQAERERLSKIKENTEEN